MKFNSIQELLNQANPEEEQMMSPGVPGDFASIDELSAGAQQVAPPVQSGLQDPGLREAEAALGNIPKDETQAPPEETQLQRLERLAYELQQNRSKELEDANRRQMYQDMISGVNSNIGLMVGGAQAMNTGAAVQAPKVGEIKQRDLAGEVDKRYKTDQTALMDKYKALLKAQNDAAKLAKGGDDWYKQAMIEERRADRALRQDMFDRGQDYREVKGDRLSDKQTDQLAGYNTTLAALRRAQELKKNIDTGPLAGRLNKAASVVGIDDPDTTALRVQVLDTVAERIKELSGTAASEREADRLNITLPGMNDSDEVFDRKLQDAEKRIKEAQQIRTDYFKKQGKDVSPFSQSENKTSAPSVITRRDPKTGRSVKYDAVTKKPLGWAD